MSHLQDVFDSLQGLDPTERVVVRNFLNDQIANDPASLPPSHENALLGLLADDPDLADQIAVSAMLARESRPYRASGE